MDPEKDVKLVQVPLGTEIGAFIAGQGKVAVLYEPNLDQAVAKGMKVVLGFPKLYGPYAFSAITTRTDADPDTTQRFVNGLEAALQFDAHRPRRRDRDREEGIPDARPDRRRGRRQADDGRQRLSAERRHHARVA